jgi:hypothetical protein
MVTKEKIKEILISLRTPKNEHIVNSLLGKIDLLTDKEITSMFSQTGDSDESIRSHLNTELENYQKHHDEEHTPINEMFTYGITGESIHLHIPKDLHQMIAEKGFSKTVDLINLQLLDAIEKIRKLKNEGFYKFKGTESIYMISPLLAGREIAFLKKLGFNTQEYKKAELQDDSFVSRHPEAQLATQIFGRNRNVGSAIIKLKEINSDEWQRKRAAQVRAFEEKGIILDKEEKKL